MATRHQLGSKALPKLIVWLILFVSATYVFYTLKLVSSSHSSCNEDDDKKSHLFIKTLRNDTISSLPQPDSGNTGLEHIFFGIAASAKLWTKRKEYIKLWWHPEARMRGIVWLDSAVEAERVAGPPGAENLRGHVEVQVQEQAGAPVGDSDIEDRVGDAELGETEGVRWFVMGDDDTVFVTENLVRVLTECFLQLSSLDNFGF